MVRFVSPPYKVTKVKRKSNARYAVGVKEGDVVQFYIGSLGMSTYGGNYATGVLMTHNGKEKTRVTQGELNGNVMKIFDFEEVR